MTRLRPDPTSLGTAVLLAMSEFAPVERVEVEPHRDPESDDEWVVIRVVVRAEKVDVAAARRRYTAAWVATVPSPQRHLFRLSPDILP